MKANGQLKPHAIQKHSCNTIDSQPAGHPDSQLHQYPSLTIGDKSKVKMMHKLEYMRLRHRMIRLANQEGHQPWLESIESQAVDIEQAVNHR